MNSYEFLILKICTKKNKTFLWDNIFFIHVLKVINIFLITANQSISVCKVVFNYDQASNGHNLKV